MSKLQELIRELCPEGVEFFTVKELTKKKTIKTITPSIKIKRNDYQKNGITPIISQELEYISGYCDFIDNSIPKNNYVCFGDHSEHIKFVDFAFVQGADGLKIMSLDEEKLMAKFFYYAISSFYVRHNNYERHFKYLNDTKIPVPPLEVQREIVRILDSFTLLTAELTAELTARTKQYEYYRNTLLSKGIEECSSSRLSEVAEIYDGTHQTPDYKLEGVPFISVENISNIYDSSKFIGIEDYKKYKIKPKIDDVFMTRIGSIGKCAIVTQTKDLAYYVSLALIRPNKSILDSRYLKHYIESSLGAKELSKRTLHNAVPIKINKDDIGKIKIKYPKLELQKRIADVLDNFDAICSDLNIGLPAEIEARQKQYEFYRDLLLTFAETGNIIEQEAGSRKQEAGNN